MRQGDRVCRRYVLAVGVVIAIGVSIAAIKSLAGTTTVDELEVKKGIEQLNSQATNTFTGIVVMSKKGSIAMGTYTNGFLPYDPLNIVNFPASNVCTVSATMNGELLSAGSGSTHVFLFWGQSDGGTVKTSWDNVEAFGVCTAGELTTNITCLEPGSFYYYCFCASNSTDEVWADGSEYFFTDWDVNYTDTALLYEFTDSSEPVEDSSAIGTNDAVLAAYPERPTWDAGEDTTESAHYHFDGTDYMRAPVSATTGGKGAVLAWGRLTSDSWTRTVFSSAKQSEGVYYVTLDLKIGTKQPRICQRNNDVWDIVKGESVAKYVWNLLAYVSSGTNYAIYCNSRPHELTVEHGSNTGDWFDDTDNRDIAAVGSFYNTGYSRDEWIGDLDRVTLYTNCISASDVDAFMKNTCVGHGWTSFEQYHWSELVNTGAVLSLNFEYDFAADTSNKGKNGNHGTKGTGGAAPSFEADGTNGWYSFDGGDYISVTVAQAKASCAFWGRTNETWHLYCDMGGTQFVDGIVSSWSNDYYNISGNIVVLGSNSTGYTTCDIDEFKIWTYSPTPCDVTNLFNETNDKFGKDDI